MPSQVCIEIAKALTDGEWHPTSYFTAVAGKFVRPEVAWRNAHTNGKKGSIASGRQRAVRGVLRDWWKAGKVERKVTGRQASWRILNNDWLSSYLSNGVKE